MKLYPFDEMAKASFKHFEDGHTIHQQFICASCKTKQTMERPNAFYKFGTCEECGYLTNIEEDGCNYMVIMENDNGV